jgi:hypothetical protein
MDSAVGKACSSSEVPLRAFWRKMGMRFKLPVKDSRSGSFGHQMGHETHIEASLIAMLLPVW